MQRLQNVCLERWVGQEVYRWVRPAHGLYANKNIALRRAIIQDIYEEKTRFGDYTFANGRQLHLVYFDVDIDWHCLQIMRPSIPNPIDFYKKTGVYHKRVERPFDQGLITIFEMNILVNGGLLTSNTVGVYDEPQPESLKEVLPTYEKVLLSPGKSHYFNPVLFPEKEDG